MNEQTRQRLVTFVQTADELLSLRFTKFVREEWNPTIAMHFSNEHGIRIDRQRPDKEAMQAFVLIFRLFVQDRDGISLRSLSNDIQQGTIDASAEWKNTFL